MPKRKSSSHASRPSKRRRIFKRKAKSSRTTTRIRSVGPIPQRVICKMKYNEMFTSTLSTLDYVYNLNSVYDPNRTGVGHQPYGFDTYQALYNRYRVFGLHYRISAAAGFLGRLCVTPANEVSPFSNMSLVQESPRAVSKELNPNKAAVISGKANLARINGSLPSVYKSDDRFQAFTTSDPAEAMGLHICVSDAIGNPASSCFVNVTLVYYVEFFDPKPVGQS